MLTRHRVRGADVLERVFQVFSPRATPHHNPDNALPSSVPKVCIYPFLFKALKNMKTLSFGLFLHSHRNSAIAII